MTIKRRLFISNILMIIIPIIIALLISFIGTIVIWIYAMKGPGYTIEYERQYYIARTALVELSEQLLKQSDVLDNKNVISQIEKTLKVNDMTVEIFNNDEKLYNFGSSTDGTNYNKLFAAIQVLGEEGSTTLGDEELYCEKILVNSNTYSVYVFRNTQFVNYDTLHTTMRSIVSLAFIGILIAIVLTNRFLTRFVFRKIEQPLDILVYGVHQIRDGNLNYRINYTVNDEFAPVCNDFNKMATQLKSSIDIIKKQEQNRKELLVGISHDLRSPLTSIKAYIEGLLDGIAKTPAAEREYMNIIKTKAEEIDSMVEKLFLFSKMDLGDYPYKPEVIDLNKEIFSLVDAISEEYADKGLKINIEYIEKDAFIFADYIQFGSIFSNIIENSLKYKNKEYGSIFISVEKLKDEVSITIDDDGPGVPEDALAKLFDVFYRSDPSRTNPNNGSGLGLAITAKAIERMGGTIYAKNREKGGLCMTIKLPPYVAI